MAFLVVWVGGATTLIVYPLKRFGVLRISEELELEGMDLSKHGGNDNRIVKRSKSVADNEILEEYIDEELQRCDNCEEFYARCSCPKFSCNLCGMCKKDKDKDEV